MTPRSDVRDAARSPEALEQKTRLAAAFRILVRMGVVRGLYQGLYGHITLRVPKAPEHFWVNSLAKRFERTTVDDLLLVSSTGEVVEGEPRALNRAAFLIHSAIHKARPDVNCAAHTHPAAGGAFAALGLPLRPIDQVGCVFFEDHALFEDYSGVVAEEEQGGEIARALGPRRALILTNHGLITVGRGVAEAVLDMCELERTCDLQLRALGSGQALRLIPDEHARQARSIRTSPKRYEHEWRLLTEELDRDEPDYRGAAARPSK